MGPFTDINRSKWQNDNCNDMGNEMNRLLSFATWGKADTFPTASMFVSEGLYFSGVGDTVICFSCGELFSDWDPSMRPDVVHKNRAPNCPMVRGKGKHSASKLFHNLSNSLKIGVTEGAHRRSDQVPNPHGTTTPGRRRDVETYSSGALHAANGIIASATTTSQTTSTASGTASPSAPNNPVLRTSSGEHTVASESVSAATATSQTTPASSAQTSSTPRPDYHNEQSRLATFMNWPRSGIVSPEDLARAGMYFTGPGDRVQCAFCHGKLEGWVPGDVPLEEHRKFFGSRCPFIQGQGAGSGRRQNIRTSTIPSRIAAPNPQPQPSNSQASASNTASVSSQPPIADGAATAQASGSTQEDDGKICKDTETLMCEFKSLQDQMKCKVCWDEDVNCVFLPCGHLVCCSVCAPALKKCPVCRAPIADYVVTFRA